MDVSADFDWCLKLEKNRLVDEDVSGLDAKTSNFLFSQLHLLSRFTSKIWLERAERKDLNQVCNDENEK